MNKPICAKKSEYLQKHLTDPGDSYYWDQWICSKFVFLEFDEWSDIFDGKYYSADKLWEHLKSTLMQFEINKDYKFEFSNKGFMHFDLVISHDLFNYFIALPKEGFGLNLQSRYKRYIKIAELINGKPIAFNELKIAEEIVVEPILVVEEPVLKVEPEDFDPKTERICCDCKAKKPKTDFPKSRHGISLRCDPCRRKHKVDLNRDYRTRKLEKTCTQAEDKSRTCLRCNKERAPADMKGMVCAVCCKVIRELNKTSLKNEMKRQCLVCAKIKLRTEFAKLNATELRNECLNCRNEYRRSLAKKNASSKKAASDDVQVSNEANEEEDLCQMVESVQLEDN